MASTPNKNRATSLGKSDQLSPNRSPNSPQNAPTKSKPKGSMGLDLLLIAIGTSLIGLGVLGYFFYQELLSSSKREVNRAAESQISQIEVKLATVRQTVDGVATSARAFSQQQPKLKTVETYQQLLVDGLQKSATLAGLGIVQNGSLIFPVPKPTVPYVWKEKSGLTLDIANSKVAGSSANNNFLVVNRLDLISSPVYKAAIAKGKESWTEPYSSLGKTIITYNVPITDGQKTLGVVTADAIASNLFALGDDTATYPDSSNESKIGFVVVSASGKVVASSQQFQAIQTSSTEALTNLAQQSKAQPVGITQSAGQLWAYRKVEGSDFLVVAYLSEAEITNKLLILVGGAAVGISTILAIAVLGFVNRLKKRLQPLTEECNRFLTQQGLSDLDLADKDEIDHLSLSLKSTLQQVKTSEFRLRNELIQTASSDQVSAAQIQQNFAESELIEAEVGDLLDVVSSMEEGDLTIEAQVSDRATGLVADTLNRLREKLVEIISSVLGTAQQVAQGASDLEELARTVVLNSAEQAQSVAQGQALTEQVAAIAQRSATQVNVANQSLQEVRDTVASGQTAINTLTERISVLQTGSAQIVQRMKTLGEFVGLAEQFVQDQGQIASLTQVLALNATLVAARAAEQKDPKQFGGVAREFEAIAGQVNDLATQTNDGLTVLQQRTSQIQTVVTAIDVEVQNLSGLVSGFTTGVEESQSAFYSIQTATEEVVQIGQTITTSSTEIAEAAGSTASYISEIAQLAERTADLTRSARQQAEAMGNQAQQLLQGIQFFRLPDINAHVTTVSAPTTPVASIPDRAATSEPVNNLLDTSAETEQFAETEQDDVNQSLGVVVPAIGVVSAAAIAGIAIAQSKQSSSSEYAEVDSHEKDLAEIDYEELNDSDLEDSDVEDSGYIFEESLSNETIENSEAISNLDLELEEVEQVQGFVDASMDTSGFLEVEQAFADVLESQNLVSYSDLTDISEESLFADLKQEIYSESSFDDNIDSNIDEFENIHTFDVDIEDELTTFNAEPTLKNPMEGVNESAIVEASSDPMIVSATSSFLEDTTFGTPAIISDDVLSNLPTSVDFNIPDLDDSDDFTIPDITIESSLDDSNSFFDAGSIPQSEVVEIDYDPDFDAFYIEQPITESVDYSLETESIFGPTALIEDAIDDTPKNIVSNVFEDYASYTSDQILNEELESSLADSTQHLPNESFSDTFDISFDESPFDKALDEALHDDQDKLFEESFVMSFDELEDELPDSEISTPDVNNIWEVTESIDERSAHEIDDSVELDYSPITETYLDESLTESLDELSSEDFSFMLEEHDKEIDLANLVESENLFESVLIQESEEFVDPVPQVDQISTFNLSEASEESSETNFPSLFGEELGGIGEDPFDEFVWQPEEIISKELSQGVNIPDFENAPQSSFDMSDFSEMTETDEALLDDVFGFDTSDDLNSLSNLMDLEEEPVIYLDKLVTDPAALLDESIAFESSNDSSNSLDEENLDLDFEEPFLFSEQQTEHLAEPDLSTEEFTNELVSDMELIDFGETSELGSLNLLDTMDLEESVIFSLLSDELNSGSSENLLDITSEIDSVETVLEPTEFTDEFSSNFSDAWLGDIADDEGDISEIFADLSIEYPSVDELSLDTSTEPSYGFADNLLDSLMEESGEEFEDVSMGLLNSPDLSRQPDLQFDSDDLRIEDVDGEFDFSAFEDPIDSLDNQLDLIVTARAEIDDFLLGVLTNEEVVGDNLKTKTEDGSKSSATKTTIDGKV